MPLLIMHEQCCGWKYMMIIINSWLMFMLVNLKLGLHCVVLLKKDSWHDGPLISLWSVFKSVWYWFMLWSVDNLVRRNYEWVLMFWYAWKLKEIYKNQVRVHFRLLFRVMESIHGHVVWDTCLRTWPQGFGICFLTFWGLLDVVNELAIIEDT